MQTSLKGKGVTTNLGPKCLGHFGVGKSNENGPRLLELCFNHVHEICITITFFVVNLHTECLGDSLDPSTGTN